MLKGRRLVGAFVVVVAAAAAAAQAAVAMPPAPAKPVPSLTPAATQKLWKKLVKRAKAHRRVLATDCKPARVVVYTESDWLRLATKLASEGSPCAQYYISIPPLAADKTKFRYDQPWRIRALGPNFHVLAEINFTGWSNWVTANNSTFYEAGLEARRRMAANGFDVAGGDTWALNELSSAVRKNTGVARQKARDLLRGLYTGDGTVPQAKGVAFDIGIGQSTGDLAPYKVQLQDWYGDTPFWQDMSAYVSDWSQELYGDVSAYAVAGASAADRRDHLDDFLGHQLALAAVAPDADAAARSYIASGSTPLANAAWIWSGGFGDTDVPVATMEDFVSGQVYALRSLDARLGLGEDRLGFAWAPRNVDGTAWTTEYTTESGQLLDRLALALRDSATTVDPLDPGIGACGPLGQNVWCSAGLDGAAFLDSWKTFATWSQPALGFASAPLTVAAGTASAPITVQLQTAGVPDPDTAPVTVTLASSSPSGTFATDPNGPWTSTVTVTVTAGSTSAAAVYYRDTTAGAVTLTATADGRLAGTQTAAVTAAPLATLTVSPASATVYNRATRTFTASGVDAFGNAVGVTPAWSVAAGTPGTVAASGATATFTADAAATGAGSVVATVGSVSASAAVTVTPAPLRVASLADSFSQKRFVVALKAVDSATGVAAADATVSLAVYRGTTLYTTLRGTTGADGRLTVATGSAVPSGCYHATIRGVTATGYAWDGYTPANQACR